MTTPTKKDSQDHGTSGPADTLRKSAWGYSHHFGVLLGALVTLFIGSGLLDYTGGFLPPRVVPVVAGLLLIFVLVAAIEIVSGQRRGVASRVARVLIVLTILMQVLGVSLESRGIGLIARALAILCIGYTIAVVLRFLMRAARVDGDTIYASICVYLLISLGWAFWYSLLEYVEPGSFAVANGLATFEARAITAELYYSLVTLTTLGYGDVVPLTTAARMSAAIEAAVGQLYVVILVARLVGINVAQSTIEPTSKP